MKFNQFRKELKCNYVRDEYYGISLLNSVFENIQIPYDEKEFEDSLSALLEAKLTLGLSKLLTENEDEENNTEEKYKNIEEYIDTKIETEEDSNRKDLFVNIKELIPVLKRFSSSYKRIVKILVKFVETDSDADEKVISPAEKEIMTDVAFDLLNVIMRNKHIVSLLGTEARAILNSEYNPLLTESTKKKSTTAKKKKKKKVEDKVTPKLDMLLRLGLVDKKLYARAKRALASKKALGSIPMYRNILFDMLDDIVKYIQKDPTLYNRLRINVMKEAKNLLPKKESVETAYESGKACRIENMEMPKEYENDHILKSAWERGYNENV